LLSKSRLYRMMTPLIATAMVSALATGTALAETPRLTTADAAQAVVLSPGTAAPASAVDNGAAAVSQAANVTTTAPHNSAQPVLIRRGENSIQVHLASDFADSQLADGLSTYRSENAASAISVNPAADGDTQFLVAVGARSAPTKSFVTKRRTSARRFARGPGRAASTLSSIRSAERRWPPASIA